MHQKNINYSISLTLSFIAFLSYLIGFLFNENSAGAGGYIGDLSLIWPNVKLYSGNIHDINSTLLSLEYRSSRMPGVYILHKFLNPFTYSLESYRISVFLFSLSLPFLFFICLKKKFKNIPNPLLVLISSTILFSPYIRTDGYWGLEENFSFFFFLLTYISLNSYIENKKEKFLKKVVLIFFISFFSSIVLYLDTKLILVPLLCFVIIFFSKEEIGIKIITLLLYSIFSIPCFYIINVWGGIMNANAQDGRSFGVTYFENICFASSIIGFYLIPIIFFIENFFEKFKNFYLKKENIFLLLIFTLYVVYIAFSYDFNTQKISGSGIIDKLSSMLFENYILKVIFLSTCFIFLFSLILFFFNNTYVNKIILVFFLLFSLISNPLSQEYFDPIIFFLIFTFYNKPIQINFNAAYVLYIYSGILIIGANFYYYNLFN